MSDTPTNRQTVKDLDPDTQPREKADKFGIKALKTSELLALILRTGVPGIPITEMTRALIENNGGSLHTLARATRQEICHTPGMGPIKAQQIEAIMELVSRYMDEERDVRNVIIRSSSDIYADMRFRLANLNHEEIWMLSLNRRNAVVRRHHLTSGSATASVFDLKRAVKLAILDEAAAIVLCHNHPSGNTRPSPQDDSITRSLRDAVKMMDMRLIDHLIITVEGYYSYCDEGRL